MRRSDLWRKGCLGLCALLLCACTVVELDENGRPIIPVDPAAVPSYSNMTPEAIAADIWQSKLMPAAEQQALSWDALKQLQGGMAENTSRSVYVRFPARVVRIDRQSREGRMEVQAQQESVSLQLGPILKGNAIRDASGFIRFEDFKNQVQFAQLSRALNKKAIQSLPSLDDGWLAQSVTVLMAVTLTKGGLSDAVPLSLHKETP